LQQLSTSKPANLCVFPATMQITDPSWSKKTKRRQFRTSNRTDVISRNYLMILATCQPSYLYNLLQLHQPSQALCSSTQQLLQVPYMSTDFGRCMFSYSSPATWNYIPSSIKNCSSLYSFKCHFSSHSPAH